MQWLLNEIGTGIVVALIANPIIVAISGLIKMAWQRMGRSPNSDPAGGAASGAVEHGLAWSDVAYAVIYTAAMVGCVVFGVAVADGMFHIVGVAQWTLVSCLVAWGIYLSVSAIGGFLAQGLLSAGNQMNDMALERGSMTRRRQVYALSLWAKLAFLPVFIGWAALAKPGTAFLPLVFGLMTFLVIDTLSAIALLLVK